MSIGEIAQNLSHFSCSRTFLYLATIQEGLSLAQYHIDFLFEHKILLLTVYNMTIFE